MKVSTSLRAIMIGIALTAAGSCSAEPSKARSDEELGQFVRDYLMEHPEIIIEAVQIYQQRLDDEAQAAKLAALPSILADTSIPSLGPDDAAITIVEFFDYNCGYCKGATKWVMNKLDSEQHDVRVVFVDLPILAPSSVTAAKASIAAEKQDKYREFHSALMKVSGLNEDKIFQVAKKIGMDVEQLKKDMASDEVTLRLDRNIALSRQAGVEATPGFFIGNDQFYSGFNPNALEKMIADAKKAG